MWLAAAWAFASFRGAAVLSSSLDASILIPPPYNGPAGRANGGYLAGVLARFFDTTFQVTYRRPVPLGRPIGVSGSPHREVLITLNDEVLAEARPADIELNIPQPPSAREAAEAARHYVGFVDHPFPHCFVCGTRRGDGDGLRIFAGPVGDASMVASPWTPHPAFAGENGRTRREVLWAALDCPGCFAALLDRVAQPAVLGRFTARVHRSPRAGEPCVVYGWPVAHDGRKHQVGTAIVDPDGALIGCAAATWIDVTQRDDSP